MRVLAGAVVLAWALALTISDVRYRRLPNRLTLPGSAVALVVAAAAGRGLPALLGAVTLAGLYLVVHLVSAGGMGAGDVKLALGLGALTGAFGAPVWVPAALGAPVLTAVIGAIALRRGRGRSVPHGPAMCLASLAAVAVAVL